MAVALLQFASEDSTMFERRLSSRVGDSDFPAEEFLGSWAVSAFEIFVSREVVEFLTGDRRTQRWGMF